MQTLVQIAFRNVAHSDALDEHLRQHCERFDRLFDRIVSCHVTIELTGHHHRQANRYQVSIHIVLPGHELLVTNAPPQDPAIETAYTVADKAFDEAERQLERWVHRRRDGRRDVSPVD